MHELFHLSFAIAGTLEGHQNSDSIIARQDACVCTTQGCLQRSYLGRCLQSSWGHLCLQAEPPPEAIVLNAEQMLVASGQGAALGLPAWNAQLEHVRLSEHVAYFWWSFLLSQKSLTDCVKSRHDNAGVRLHKARLLIVIR